MTGMCQLSAISDDDDVIRKCRFYRSLFCNFSRADDHWEGILDLKYAAPCR